MLYKRKSPKVSRMPYSESYRTGILDRLRREIRKHKSGIWLKDIARNCGLSPQQARYYLIGFNKNVQQKNRGGYLRDEIETLEKYHTRVFIKPKTESHGLSGSGADKV